MSKAEQSLDAADRELAAGDLSLAINRVDYACFYAVSAVLCRKRLAVQQPCGCPRSTSPASREAWPRPCRVR
ncbi:MAG: HEPN domain-containing protein [Phycisphaerae bacterium]